MPAQAFTWKSFHDRMKDVDPDLRQMALFDLQQELAKDSFTLNEDEQNKALDKVLGCFGKDEKHSEVHSNAVRILTALVPKLTEANRIKLARSIVQIMVGPQPSDVKADQLRQLRENACMGAKAICEALKKADEKIASEMVTLLLAAFKQDDARIRMDAFDVITDLFEIFGTSEAIIAKHSELQDAAFTDFEKGNNSIRKKAVNCLAHLCQYSSDELFQNVVEKTVSGLSNNKGEKLRRYIQLCNSISRNAASRFGSSVAQVVPFFFKELDRLDGLDDDDRESVESDEVRENILQALDSFVARCTSFIAPLLPEIVSRCGELIKWDPNYCDDADEEEEDLDDEFEDDMDDDSDVSWKVRKSAARCLVEAIRARPDQLPMFIDALVSEHNPLLPSRFRERVENVRLEVLEVFQSLLEISKVSIPTDQREEGSFAISSTFTGGSFRMMVESRAECKGFLPLKETIIKSLLSCSRHKSPKVKLAAFTILRDLFVLIGNDLANSVPDCFDAAIQNLSDPKLALPQLRPEVLNFTRLLTAITVRLLSHDDSYENLLTHVEKSFPVVFKCAEDRFFKTVVASLRVCSEFVAAVRMSANHEDLAKRLFACVNARLSTGDADQEVKRAAIDTMAKILNFLENSLKSVASDIASAHQQILALLKSDTTRLAASKAVNQIVRCNIDASIVKQYAAELSTLLRKTDRQVRESGLRTLTAIIPVHLKSIEASTYASIVDELTNESTAILNDKELFLASLGLQLSQRLVAAPGVSDGILKKIVPRTLKLLKSPLVQGQPVRDAADLFRAISASNDIPYASLLSQTMAATKEATPATISNLAAVVGVTVASDPDASRRGKTIEELAAMVKSGKDDQAVIGLTCLGDVGRSTDLTSYGSVVDVIRSALASPKEEVKAAASSALGRAASASSGKPLLDDIIKRVRGAQGSERYFLFRAIKESVTAAGQDSKSQSPLRSADTRGEIIALLLEYAGSDEEGIGDVVGECLGRYALIDVNDFVPKYAAALNGANDNARATIVSALKFTIAGLNKNKAAEAQAVEAHLDTFLSLLTKQQPLAVRRAVLQLFSTIAYSKSSVLCTERFKTAYMPGLIAELAVDTSLVKEVDLGPFKHRVDSGLDTRKIAYECLSTLVDGISRPHSVLDFFGDYNAIVEALQKGIYVPEVDIDINNLARSMISRVAKAHAGSAAVMAHLDTIGKSLELAIGTKAKDGQEPEKVAEGQKYAIVCVIGLSNIAGATQNAAFAAAVKKAQGHVLFNSASQIAAAE